MLDRFSPIQLMLMGFGLLVIGIVLPFLMVLRIVESTLFLGFVAYLTSFLGLIIGLIGVIFWGRVRHRDDDDHHDD